MIKTAQPAGKGDCQSMESQRVSRRVIRIHLRLFVLLLAVIGMSACGGSSSSTSISPPPATNPVPSIISLSPSTATAGGAAFTLTVNGSNFISTSVVQWNGGGTTTSYVSATQLTASITAADIATVGSASVTVVDPAPGGGASIAAIFTIGGTAPPPSVITGALTACNSDFYSNSTIPAVCYLANLANCPNASNLNFTYSYDNPGSPKGTIVFFPGSSGTSASGDDTPAGYYFGLGYEIVQIEWAYDWEITNAPAQYTGNNSSTSYPANIQVAACREATFLNFIFNTSNKTLYSGGGRCAQGSSAGSAAIAYALAFYGAGNYLDAVELKSGPPLADIEQGCEEPAAPDVTICPAGQIGCELGGTAPWVLSPTYDQQAATVQNWTNDSSCAVAGTITTPASNLAWLQQSIVNDGTNNPTYSYPKTAMTAWLCQNVYDGSQCVGGQGGTPVNDCPNNSSSQGEIFYERITSGNITPQAHYAVYAVQNCTGSEGVDGQYATVPALNNLDGTDAIQQDMMAQCPQ
jgi:hypothetical protein